jgi:predicted nucleotidyltransferase
MVSEGQIAEVLKNLVRGFDPERVILFGSYARGTATDDRDLDLLILKEGIESKSFMERYSEAMISIRGKKSAPAALKGLVLDLLVYSPAEWQTLLKENQSLAVRILKEGRLLYKHGGSSHKAVA